MSHWKDVVIAVLLVAGASACKRSDQDASSFAQQPAVDQPWFTERAEQVGLDFVHVNGRSGRLYLPEIIGPGVALLDYDNDGDLDLYAVQGQVLENRTRTGITAASRDPEAPTDQLYRNDLAVAPDGRPTLRFINVTEKSGIRSNGYGMGVATGDIDNNGCIDIYVTRFGTNQMFRNNCNGTFSDVSKESGTDDSGWSVSASFFDFDRDGWLDLFVGHYLNYTLERHTDCFSPAGRPDYCAPQVYRAQPSRLYRNAGKGRFVDVTARALIAPAFGPALGAIAADFDRDGWIDLYVANDGAANQLWMNRRDGTFEDRALLAGAALTVEGRAEASMGVDAGDVDNDGDDDIVVTELTAEGTNLFVNDGTGMFEDRSVQSGLGPASLSYTGFGTGWFDFDNDGWLDTVSANGAVRIITALEQRNDPFPLHQQNQLLRNLGNGRFEDVTEFAKLAFDLSEVSRGVAFGDIDNDGDVDLVVSNNSGPLRMLVNELGNRKHWIGLRLVGRDVGRDMLGARVEVSRNGLPTFSRRVRTDGSYASASDPRVLVGLGSSSVSPRVRVVWPGGQAEEFVSVGVDRWTTLKEGGGK
jgi:enediyne biosynthesis protein E4